MTFPVVVLDSVYQKQYDMIERSTLSQPRFEIANLRGVDPGQFNSPYKAPSKETFIPLPALSLIDLKHDKVELAEWISDRSPFLMDPRPRVAGLGSTSGSHR